MIERLQKLRDSVNFQNVIIATIFCSTILIGIENHPYIEENFNFLTHGLEQLFLGIFVVELIIRIGAEGRRPWRFFTNNWNIFDFLIVVISFFPGNNFIVVLRLVRILRILRLLVRIREAQVEKVKNKETILNYNQFVVEFENYKTLAKKKNHKNILEIRKLIQNYNNIGKIHLGGIPMIADDMMSFIKNDITVFGTGVFLFIVATLWFIFRKLLWIIVPLSSCFFAVIIMTGLLGLLGWKVTVISSNFIESNYF